MTEHIRAGTEHWSCLTDSECGSEVRLGAQNPSSSFPASNLQVSCKQAPEAPLGGRECWHWAVGRREKGAEAGIMGCGEEKGWQEGWEGGSEDQEGHHSNRSWLRSDLSLSRHQGRR